MKKGSGRHAARSLTLAGVASCALAGTAGAAVTETVRAGKASARTCHARYVGDTRATDVVRTTAPSTGLVHARLSGRGDWDVAVFDAKTRRYVAGSAAPRSNELAEGFVRKGQALLVQACRFRGSASTARLKVTFVASPAKARAASAGKTQVVDVKTGPAEGKRRLQALGLDLTEHADAKSVEVVLHGNDDVRKLEEAGFKYEVKIADLAARSAANRKADRRFAAETAQTGLPSGRDSYRRLADYEAELKQLGMRFPGLVQTFALPEKSVLGRDILGVEITPNVANLLDGKPIFLNMGVHHAREWPSSEHAMEWAYDLATNFGRSERTTRLLEQTRSIVIPVVNPDGFNISREAAPRGDFSLFDYEMKRKNCAISEKTPAFYATGTCDNNNAGRLRGTDPNRNYGGLWGGAGASVSWSSDTYRGDGPFSEPETRNIRHLHSTRNITNLISNHTYSNLLLRPPGVADVGFPLEEPLAESLGAEMAAHNEYANIPSFGLYDTTGSTEDWTFWTAGSMGYTFEIGPDEFHPPFEQGVVAEYLGLDPAAGAGKGGNREAYYKMLEATADPRYHATIVGNAPKGTKLTISKTVDTSTSPVWRNNYGTDIGEPIVFEDRFTYSMTPSRPNGKFAWQVNPSTRPIVRGRHGRDKTAEPQAGFALANPDGIPAENTGSILGGPHEEIPFTVEGPPAVDNGKMTVHIEWTDPAVDWDLYILDASGNVVTQSASFGDNTEDAVLFDPPAGEYRAIIVNYDQAGRAEADWDDWRNGTVAFESPRPTTYGPQEAWTLTCERADGRGARSTERVVVDRGETVDVGNICKVATP